MHTGEIELRDDDVAGIAVHLAARVAAEAGAGEVLVSRTVVDLVAGSGIGIVWRMPSSRIPPFTRRAPAPPYHPIR